MPNTSNPSFNEATEALEVAEAFPSQIRGKTILITGVNLKGIGFATANALASQHPARLIIAGRSTSKVDESINALRAAYPSVVYRPLRLDLSSQSAVRKAATEVLSWNDVPVINIVVNSAGIMNLPERTLSEDGLEMHMATNHIGHFLFTNLLMPKLIAAAANEGNAKGATRIVNVSSLSPTWSTMRWSDLNFEKVNHTLPQVEQPPYEIMRAWGMEDPENATYLPLEGYNQSKVANLLCSIGLTQRLFDKYGILSVAAHPGVIGTELGRNTDEKIKTALSKLTGSITIKTLGAGASTSLVAALDPGLAEGEVGGTKSGKQNYGSYLVDCQISERAMELAVKNDEADRLWTVSEELVGQKFEW